VTYHWEALNARVRGLTTHLLSDEQLGTLERAANVTELPRLLRETQYARFILPRDTRADALEVGVTRSLADRMATLARWARPDISALRPIFLEQDMRNVRAIVRGAVGALTTEQRLSSVIPTPTLDRRALETLARADSAGSVAATLTAWGHPLGSALLKEAKRTHPDPFLMETALARCLAREASDDAKHGGKFMCGFVSEALDTQNIVTAILLAGAPTETPLADFFVDGGAHLSRPDFTRAAAAANRIRCADLLARATRGTVFATPLREPPASPTAASARILQARIDHLTTAARREPLSALPVLLFVLRLRREVLLLRRALWSASLRRRSPA
jgi:vacuolar-type H+-ATPase subunit C/Vma6